jgi:hypothetical protein
MTATTPVAFDPAPRRLGTVKTYTASGAILAGQIVGFLASGTSEIVTPSTNATGSPVGVALYSAADGTKVAVAGDGSELKVMLAADDGVVDSGHWVTVSAVAGCALVMDPAIQGSAAEAAGYFPVGQALEDITAGAATVGGKGYIRINRSPIWTS